MKVLIINQNQDVLARAKKMFERRGCDVICSERFDSADRDEVGRHLINVYANGRLRVPVEELQLVILSDNLGPYSSHALMLVPELAKRGIVSVVTCSDASCLLLAQEEGATYAILESELWAALNRQWFMESLGCGDEDTFDSSQEADSFIIPSATKEESKAAPPSSKEESILAKVLTPVFAVAAILAVPLALQVMLASFTGANFGIQPAASDAYMHLLNWLGAVLAVLSAVSLFMKDEGIRGTGRIVLGCYLQLLAANQATMINLVYAEPSTSQLCPSYIGAFFGLVLIGSGIHKYRQRNKPRS